MKKQRAAAWMVLSAIAGIAWPASRVEAQSVMSEQPGLAHEELRSYEGPPLTLTDVLRETAERNIELAALRLQIDVMRQRPAAEHGLSPPMFEAQIWQWPINTINPTNTSMYMLSLQQELPGRGKRDLRAAVAEKDTALAEIDVTGRARQIVNEVKQAYAALFIARKAIDIHFASVELLRQIADVAQAKYASGRISQQDVLKPVVELSRLHGDIVMFDEQASLATARLNVLRGLPPETPIGPLVEPQEQMILPASADLQRLSLESYPELQRARLEVERAEAELASTKGEYKPDFTVQGSYVIMPGQTDAVMASFGVTWPNAPWSHGRLDARVAERTAAASAARARAAAMENNVRLAVQESWARARSAQDRARLQRTTIVPQSRQAFEVSRIAYQADRVDFQSVIDSERMLLEAQLGYFRALSELSQAMADLERAVGSEIAPGGLPSGGGAAR